MSEHERDRMGGDPATGEPHFTEIVVEKQGKGMPMPLNAAYDPKTGGIILRNFDGYVLPAGEILYLLDLALKAAEAYGEEQLLQANRERAEAERINQEELAASRGKPRPKKPTDGHVYLLESGGRYKIGRAKDPTSRAETIGTQLAEPATLLCSFYAQDYRRAEADMHEWFADKRLNGEWFALDDADVAYFKGFCE